MTESDHLAMNLDVGSSPDAGTSNTSNQQPITAQTTSSCVQHVLLSLAVLARRSAKALAPIANSAARRVSRNAQSAYIMATSSEAVATYRYAGGRAAKAASVTLSSTVNTASKVRDIASSDDAKQVYEKIATTAGMAATHGAKLAGDAVSLAGEALRSPITRNVAAGVAAIAVTQLAEQLGASQFVESLLNNVTYDIAQGLGTAGGGGTTQERPLSDAPKTDRV
jgi:hypothetical protein